MGYEDIADRDTWFARLRRIGEDIRALTGRDTGGDATEMDNPASTLEGFADEFRSAVLPDVTRAGVDAAQSTDSEEPGVDKRHGSPQ